MTTRYISVEVYAAAKTIMVREASADEQEKNFPLYPMESAKHIFRIQQHGNGSQTFPRPGADSRPIVGGLNDLFGHLVFVTLDSGSLLDERERVIQNSYQARATAQDFFLELDGPTVIIEADAARHVSDRQMFAILKEALQKFGLLRGADPSTEIQAIAWESAIELKVVLDHTANILLIRGSGLGRSTSIPVQLGL